MEDQIYGRLRRSIELLDVENDNRILNIGCKSGWLEKEVSNKCKEIIGIDIDSEIISKNKKEIKSAKFFIADITKRLSFGSGFFDKICFLEVIEHLPKDMENMALKEINRLLKINGILILSTPNNNFFCKFADPAYWVIGHRHYDFDFIKEILVNNGFEIEHFEYGGRWIETLTIPFFSFFWYFKLNIPFKHFFSKLTDREYKKENGWYTILIKAKKVKNVE